jgi:hypothetical protein
MSEDGDLTPRPLEEFPGFEAALRAAIVWDRFLEDELPAMDYGRPHPDSPSYMGNCPSCGQYFAEATLTERGLSYHCPKGCTIPEIRDAVERRSWRHKYAKDLVEQDPSAVIEASGLTSMSEIGKARVNQRDEADSQ